jgi:hypothetical protein
MEQADQRLQRAKTNYNNAAREWETVLIGLYREQEHGDMWASSASKLRDKETASCAKCEQMKTVYISEVSSANQVQNAHNFQKMPQLLNRLTHLAHDVVSVVCTALQTLQQHCTKTLDAELFKAMGSTAGWSPLESLDINQYCYDFILCHFNNDNAISPQPYAFREYLMADEAASVHAKKVQYEIIKCLPSASLLGMQAKPEAPKEDSTTFYTDTEIESQISTTSVSGSKTTDGPASVEAPEQLLENVNEAAGQSDSNTVSSMISLRQAMVRGGQRLKSKFTRDAVVTGEAISGPVLQPWPYNLDLMAEQLPSHPISDSPQITLDLQSSLVDTADSAPFLIRCCVAYLQQPVALQEEGLFRVPGDMTRIQQLQAAFTAEEEGTPNSKLRSFLMQEISAELNPNTVAGLLKMYLRQKGVFSKEESRLISDISRVVKGDVFEACKRMRDALKDFSKRSYDVLQSVITLLQKVVSHSEENKMSVQAVCLSCGLSVFPHMFSTGDAVGALKFFLINYHSLFVVVEDGEEDSCC